MINPADIPKIRAHLMTVLVVDDDEMIRSIIIKLLEPIGFAKFIEAGNGAEAHKYMLDPRVRVDLILCDWEMPKTDGLTFLRAVRALRHRTDTPFIMVTSQQSQERMKISQAKKHEVSAYVVKPFRGDTLRDKVFHVLYDAVVKKLIAA